jgi:hypothetical protein
VFVRTTHRSGEKFRSSRWALGSDVRLSADANFDLAVCVERCLSCNSTWLITFYGWETGRVLSASDIHTVGLELSLVENEVASTV